MTKVPSNLKKQSAYLTVGLWLLRHLWLTTALVALTMLVLGFTVLWYSRSIASQHSFRKDFLVNVAAGFLEISIGTLVAAGLTWVVTQSKFQEIARPALDLIQSLRLGGTIKKETARKSVVFAVALLSENNVSKSLKPGDGELNGRCPICALPANPEMERCFHCHLPQTVWNDAQLVAVDEKDETMKIKQEIPST